MRMQKTMKGEMLASPMEKNRNITYQGMNTQTPK